MKQFLLLLFIFLSNNLYSLELSEPEIQLAEHESNQLPTDVYKVKSRNITETVLKHHSRMPDMQEFLTDHSLYFSELKSKKLDMKRAFTNLDLEYVKEIAIPCANCGDAGMRFFYEFTKEAHELCKLRLFKIQKICAELLNIDYNVSSKGFINYILIQETSKLAEYMLNEFN